MPFRWHVVQDDNLDVLRALPDCSIDAIVQDPPANLSFMANSWDDFRRAKNVNDAGRDNAFGRASKTSPEMGRTKKNDGGEAFIAYLTERFIEERRVLKPGGYALTWAIPKTSDWTATALRRAGLLIDDTIHTLMDSGEALAAFVESLSSDQLTGLERVLAASESPTVLHRVFGSGMPHGLNVAKALAKIGSSEAVNWSGWLSELKPAVEHWLVGQKPIEKGLTIAKNVLKWGTGAMNIGACRVVVEGARPLVVREQSGKAGVSYSGGVDGTLHGSRVAGETTQARYPAHLVLDEAGAAALDAQSGDRRSAGDYPSDAVGSDGRVSGGKHKRQKQGPLYVDTGGASRYFYQAKASSKDKTADGEVVNKHPTVKSIALLRWLCRLVTPPGGLVADFFCGSGSQGVACAAEGFRFLGIERGEIAVDGDDKGSYEYINTAYARCAIAYEGANVPEDDDEVTGESSGADPKIITASGGVRPFLRWVGGKRKQAAIISSWCASKLKGRYFEPFLGGGAVALAMPAGTPMVLADYNLALVWLWWWVKHDPGLVAEYAAGFGLNLNEGWNTQEGYYQARTDHNAVWQAAPGEETNHVDDHRPSARFLWLLHACFNGLYRENKGGGYNCPWGKRDVVPVPGIAHLQAVADRLKDADVRPGWDYEDVIAEAGPGDVVYADPPYDSDLRSLVDLRSFTGYTSKPFGTEAQENLAKVLGEAVARGAAVCANNADTELVRKLYGEGGLGFDLTEVQEGRMVAADASKRGPVKCLRMTSK